MPTDKNFAEPFRAMAARVEKNADDFGGCMLLVTPEGEVVDILIVGSKADPEHFWATVRGKLNEAADSAIAKLAQAAQQGFRRG